jgi:hypothetical protein
MAVAVGSAMTVNESSKRNAGRTRKDMRRKRYYAKKARARQKVNIRKHKAKIKWLNAWKKKKLAAIKKSGASAASQRRSRIKVMSKYNRWRRVEQARYRKQNVRNFVATGKLTVRTTTDIFEHYDIHRLFSSDLSVAGISDIVAGQIAGSTPHVEDEYAANLDEGYQRTAPLLDLGVVTLTPDMLTWTEVFDDAKVRTWTVVINVPNSEGFYQIKARINT